MRQVWMNVMIVFPVTGLVVLAACGGGDVSGSPFERPGSRGLESSTPS